MKRALSILLATLFLLTALPLGAISVSAATTGTTGDCQWTLEDDHLTIRGSGAMGDYTASEKAPWGTAITTVIIESGVTSIGKWAFSYCQSLTSINIPDSVTSIGDYAFLECENLTSITIPDSVTSIGEGAFLGCDNLTSVTIPDSVTNIGNSAFYHCKNLTSITIPDSVTSIGHSAFYTCISLISITIPDSITSIGVYAFSGCISLTSITIPDSVTSIGDCAFADCTSLTSVTIPDSVTSIGNYAFYNCTRLSDVYYNGTPEDRAAISIGSNNSRFTSATWHYFTGPYDAICNECGEEREVSIPTKFGGNSISEDISGLAFRFDMRVEGMTVNGTTAIYDNATMKGYKVLSMGAVVANYKSQLDIPAVYLCDLEPDSAGFAVRVKNIPAYAYDIAITATPYIVLEIDGVATTIYGEAQTCSYNDAKN